MLQYCIAKTNRIILNAETENVIGIFGKVSQTQYSTFTL